MPYSLFLVESKKTNSSLLDAFNGENYRVVAITSVDELNKQLTHMLPDAVVVDTEHNTVDASTVQATIAETNIGIPCVSVRKRARKMVDEDARVTICTRKNVVKTLSTVLRQSPILRVGTIVLDTSNNSLWVSGDCHHLTPKMAGLMRLLLQNAGQIVFRETIMREIWETDYLGDTRTLDVHIRWLREKLEENPSRPKILLTVRGAGYRLMTPEP